MAKFKFEVLEGRHEEGIDPNRTLYEKGDVVESDSELDVLFANKFRRVGGKTKNARGTDHSLDNSGRVMDDKLAVKKARKEAEDDEDEDEDKMPRGFAAKSEDGKRVRGTAEEDNGDEDEEVEGDDEDKKEGDEDDEPKPKKLKLKEEKPKKGKKKKSK